MFQGESGCIVAPQHRPGTEIPDMVGGEEILFVLLRGTTTEPAALLACFVTQYMR